MRVDDNLVGLGLGLVLGGAYYWHRRKKKKKNGKAKAKDPEKFRQEFFTEDMRIVIEEEDDGFYSWVLHAPGMWGELYDDYHGSGAASPETAKDEAVEAARRYKTVGV